MAASMMTAPLAAQGNMTTMKQNPKEPKVARPIWMNEEQFSIYKELLLTSDAMFEALLARDLETWSRLKIRWRDMIRLVDDKMFRGGNGHG